MAFEDEARTIGLDFLDLVPGNLRETSQYFRDKYGINVPYSSYAKLWSSLVGQLGIVDAVRKILQDFIQNLSPDVETLTRKAVRQPLTEQEYESIDRWWFLVDDDTRKISRLGLFVLNYGADQFKELGRLSAVRVYHISRCIHFCYNLGLKTKLSSVTALSKSTETVLYWAISEIWSVYSDNMVLL